MLVEACFAAARMKDGAMHLCVAAVRTLEANNAVKLRGEHSETSAHEREVNPNEYKGDALNHSGPSTAVKGIDRLEGQPRQIQAGQCAVW